MDPEAAGWSTDTYLLAAAVDYLAVQVWQAGGNKNARKPEPIWRPHAKPKKRGKSLTAEALKGKSTSE